MYDNLTPKELAILKLMAIDRMTVNQISEKLLISKRTVHYHLQNIYKKQGYEPNARSQMKLALEYADYVSKQLAKNED
jgi:DNA-binding NarL/FixJ family response regulator